MDNGYVTCPHPEKISASACSRNLFATIVIHISFRNTNNILVGLVKFLIILFVKRKNMVQNMSYQKTLAIFIRDLEPGYDLLDDLLVPMLKYLFRR